MDVIATSGLSKVYRGWFGRQSVYAVVDLNLTVPEGGIFGFLGPNGAGKTTTLKMLLGLIRPTRGSGQVLNKTLGDPKALEKIGFLPEEPAFSTHLRADTFLEFCGKLLHLSQKERIKRIPEVLKLVRLEDRSTTKIGSFSRGMLQRIGIAQALLNDPELLLLDEPMTGLDPAGRKEVKDILLELGKKGKTIFFSSHILSDVEALCEQVGILNKGRLIAQGPLSDLLHSSDAQIRATAVKPEALALIEPLVTDFSKHGDLWTFQIASPDNGTQKRVTVILNEYQAKNVHVTQRRQSLEEFFLEGIARDEQQLKK